MTGSAAQGPVRNGRSVKGLIRRVEAMPSLPGTYGMIDWQARTRAYIRLIYDFEARGDFLPLAWIDRSGRNSGRPSFGLPSYVSSRTQRQDGSQEAINCVAAILSASLTDCLPALPEGIDPVASLEIFFNRDNGSGLFLDRPDTRTGGSFWYEIHPLVLLAGILDRHPDREGLRQAFLLSAGRWLEALDRLGWPIPDFRHTAFDFAAMRPVDNGRWQEPDAAGGLAYIFLCAHVMTGSELFLQGALRCLEALDRMTDNPHYELLLPYGALAAARCNAWHGTSLDVARMVNWCFDGDSAVRPGWGVIAESWGEYDCHGLCGSLTDWGQRWDQVEAASAGSVGSVDPIRSGYAFAGNTFSMVGALLPLVRYDARFARDLGRWVLHAASASRLFYPDAHPRVRQSCWFWREDTESAIAYEGLRKWWDGQSPYATGDPIRYSWGSIDLGLYGSSYVGNLGATVRTTDVDGILALDCSITDFHGLGGPRILLVYNPHADARIARVDGIPEPVAIPPDDAVLVEAPEGRPA